MNKRVQGKDLIYFQGTARVRTWLLARLRAATPATESHLAWLEMEKVIDTGVLGMWETRRES